MNEPKRYILTGCLCHNLIDGGVTPSKYGDLVFYDDVAADLKIAEAARAYVTELLGEADSDRLLAAHATLLAEVGGSSDAA